MDKYEGSEEQVDYWRKMYKSEANKDYRLAVVTCSIILSIGVGISIPFWVYAMMWGQ